MKKGITILAFLFCVTNSYTQTERNNVEDTSKLHLKFMGWPTQTWGFAFANPINHIQMGVDYDIYKGWFISADFQYSRRSYFFNGGNTLIENKDVLLGLKKRIVNMSRYQFSTEIDYLRLSELIFVEHKPQQRGTNIYEGLGFILENKLRVYRFAHVYMDVGLFRGKNTSTITGSNANNRNIVRFYLNVGIAVHLF